MIDWIIGALVVAGGLFGSGKKRSQPSTYSVPRVDADESRRQAEKDWRSGWEHNIDRSRWIPQSAAHRIIEANPLPGPVPFFVDASTRRSAKLRELLAEFATHNQSYLAAQKAKLRQFFDTVEKAPLTDEQAEACICMDDAVLVVAAAGSGKTSTMVAKTGYVLHEGLATPDQILLLAFNRATADEVGERIAEQLRDVPDVDQVRSNTFHAFGMDVIGNATGKRPSLAPWVEPDNAGADIREVSNIIATLSAQDASFKRDWDLFRTIYARDVGRWGQVQEPEHYAQGKRGFLTAKGHVVKSKEERIIADWLFYHGVNYEYEPAYEYDTADEHHRQYFPDFHYPDAGLYHEHFALNAKGEAPKEFKDYLKGVEWKRKIHAAKGTALIETTSHSLKTGAAIFMLERELVSRSVELNFDPKRQSIGLPPVSERDLARSFRVFQQHVKNNGLTHDQLLGALKEQSEDGYAARLRMYLSLYERIAAEWERRLRAGKFIDFEDMLIQAAAHVESGQYKSPYTIILADEFQDSSRARIRLLKALSDSVPAQTHLCVVGDDWQSINRFAGSDITVMTEFEKTFGYSTRLKLNTTFRCPQSLCDVSSEFIQANPVQIAKTVKTKNTLTKTPILAFAFKDKDDIPTHVERQLEEIDRYASQGKLKPLKGKRISIMILGRYRNDRPAALAQWAKRFEDHLEIDYRTVHSSKGLEAEYVFILNVVQGTMGFPSQIHDDPALQLAMPAPDPYPYSEERRLFYVAMTRARKQVRFYTTFGEPSQFLVELAKNGHLKLEPIDGEPLESCPGCGNGLLQLKSGKHRAFYGCSRFPACGYKRHATKQEGAAHRQGKNQSYRIREPVKAGDSCPICGHGVLQRRNGRNGPFLGCSRFPAGCKATSNISSPSDA
jgi:DNA helicase IV